MKLIVSSCCEAKLKFVAREVAKPAMFSDGGMLLKRRELGERVRAYVCEKCGKKDR